MNYFQIFTAAAVLAGFATASPRVHDTAATTTTATASDGFPSPDAAQLAAIERKADGQLSNAPPPPKLANSSLTAFQLIAFNENFEVAFFSSLINNITAGVSGYEVHDGREKEQLLNVLETVLAQEELHALTAIGILKNFGAFAPSPCTYKFPVDDLKSAISFAETFTAVVLGTLQDASQLLATNGDAGPVRAIASVIGQEGEQNGFYRTLLGLKPSEKPFLTTSIAAYAFSKLQDFIVSCPFDIAASIPIPIFTPLNVLSGDGGADVKPEDQDIKYEADLSGVAAAKPFVGGSGEGLFITYLTGQNLPVSEPVKNVAWDGAKLSFAAFFPFEENVMEALSIAGLTIGGNFSDPDALTGVTLAAPGLIQVNDRL